MNRIESGCSELRMEKKGIDVEKMDGKGREREAKSVGF